MPMLSLLLGDCARELAVPAATAERPKPTNLRRERWVDSGFMDFGGLRVNSAKHWLFSMLRQDHDYEKALCLFTF